MWILIRMPNMYEYNSWRVVFTCYYPKAMLFVEINRQNAKYF